jgi:hypothetical protein
MPISNFTNADIVGALGSALSPIGNQIVGLSQAGVQGIIGILLLLFFAAVLALRNAPMELMAVVLFPSAIVLYTYGWLPIQVLMVVSLAGLIIIGLVIVRFRQG